MRRGLVTLLTMGLLFSFLLAIVVGLMLYVGLVSLPIAVAIVIGINVITLAVSPWLNDLIYRWLYDVAWLSPTEFERRSTTSMAVIDTVTDEYGYKTPKIGIIPDQNPTAFTYGSGRYNARIVITEGCFEYLDDDELASVIAHELGHITSRDFIIMTLANTIIQILYLVAVNSMKIARTASSSSSSSSRRTSPASVLAIVGLVAYVFWFFSEYIVLYLSRTREYAADEFASEYTDGDTLSMALIKIALGLVLSEDSPELAKATRNLGIMSVAQSKEKGLLYHNARERDDMAPLLQALLFDLVSPWAQLFELNSTHPLTGKRIRRLAASKPSSRFDFQGIRDRFPIDRRRLYREFGRDLLVLVLPMLFAIGVPIVYLGFIVTEIITFSVFTFAGGWLIGFGIALLIGARYRYPSRDPKETTVLELLTNVYASPINGEKVELSGKLIGRGTAGYRFSEDLMFQDETGLMYLKYDSWLPVLGDLLFSVNQVPDLIGDSVTVDGWYFRATSPWMGLHRLTTSDRTIKGFIHLGSFAGAVIMILLGVVVLSLPVVI